MCSRYLRLLDLSSSLLSSLPLSSFSPSSRPPCTRSRVWAACCSCHVAAAAAAATATATAVYACRRLLSSLFLRNCLSFSWRDSSNNESKYCVAFVQAVFSSEDRINDTFADILIIRITSRSRCFLSVRCRFTRARGILLTLTQYSNTMYFLGTTRFISFVVTHIHHEWRLDYYKSASECSMNRFLDSFERICYLYIWEIFQV